MKKITIYTWDAVGNFAGATEVYEHDPMPQRSTTSKPPSNDYHWAGSGWAAGQLSTPEPQPLQISSAQLRTALTAEYERRMQAIAAGYPPSERESWPVQTSEAYALLADPQASTPWIDAASAARGLDRLELAQRIVAKDAQYRVISGTLSGVRQRIEDQIDAAGDPATLQAIDVTQGWPE